MHVQSVTFSALHLTNREPVKTSPKFQHSGSCHTLSALILILQTLTICVENESALKVDEV